MVLTSILVIVLIEVIGVKGSQINLVKEVCYA